MELIVKRFNELTNTELYEILRLRVDVFVVEQNCPYHELDGADYNAVHVFYMEDGRVLSYVRVFENKAVPGEVRIGRVVSASRKGGFGMKALNAGIDIARRDFGASRIMIGAQVQARQFYEKAQFRQVSDVYDEDGIPHIRMVLELSDEKE